MTIRPTVAVAALLAISLTAVAPPASFSQEREMTDETTPESALAFAADQYRDTAAAVAAFHGVVDQVRPDLYRYCASLTRTPWDAEDLCQETLVRALKRIGETRTTIGNVRAWMFRVATNVWIDELRRHRPELLAEEATVADDNASADDAGRAIEISDALLQLIRRLAPRERVCVLLKDVFDLSLQDVAAAAGTSVGGVKAALHRGREKLRAASGSQPATLTRAAAAEESLAAKLAVAFNARDVDGILALLHESCEVDLVGFHVGHDRKFATNVVGHTFGEDGLLRAEAVRLDNRDALLLWYSTADGSEVLGDVWMPSGGSDSCTAMRIYYFCPDMLAAIGRALGTPVQRNPYRY